MRSSTTDVLKLRSILMRRFYYFGCWNEAGHYMFAPDGRPVPYAERFEHYGDQHINIDGTLAPRRHKRGHIVWTGQARDRAELHRLEYDSEECPEGQFLRHTLDFHDHSKLNKRTTFTVLQWWDRNQGDRRGACNSSILVDGEHTTAQMLDALAEHFPHVLANLQKAGVQLVEIVVSREL
jgi:hypothetical protein